MAPGVSLILLAVDVTGCLLVFELRMIAWLAPLAYVQPRAAGPRGPDSGRSADPFASKCVSEVSEWKVVAQFEKRPVASLRVRATDAMKVAQ